MNLYDLAITRDIQFYNKCLNEQPGEKYFQKIRYDKTLGLREDQRLIERSSISEQDFDEIHSVLREAVLYTPEIMAARITGSSVVGLVGSARRGCEEVIEEDGIWFKSVPIEKRPDVDVEVILLDCGFIGSSNYLRFKSKLENMDKKGLRISVGYIDRRTSCKYSVRNIVRWGFLRNEAILKNPVFYFEESRAVWEFLKKHKRERELTQLVGVRHLFYAFKNVIRYEDVKEVFLPKSDYEAVYAANKYWEATHTDLFLKEDYE